MASTPKPLKRFELNLGDNIRGLFYTNFIFCVRFHSVIMRKWLNNIFYITDEVIWTKLEKSALNPPVVYSTDRS